MAPSLIIRDATNTARTITGIVVRDATNTSRTLTEMRVRDGGGTSRIVFAPVAALSLSISPGTVIGSSAGTGTATTSPASVATPSGGTGPYTYQWTLLADTGPVDPTANNPTGAGTTFTQTSMSPGEFYTSDWECEVTDSLMATATATCNANFLDTA